MCLRPDLHKKKTVVFSVDRLTDRGSPTPDPPQYKRVKGLMSLEIHTHFYLVGIKKSGPPDVLSSEHPVPLPYAVPICSHKKGGPLTRPLKALRSTEAPRYKS